MNQALGLLLLFSHVFTVLGVLRIVSVAPISSSWPAVKVMLDGETLWREMINARGGVLVNGFRHLVDVISVDVGAPTEAEMRAKVNETVQKVANGSYGEVHAMFAPYTSQLTEEFALATEKHKILGCASGGSSPKLFQCDRTVMAPCRSSQGRRFQYLVGLQANTEALYLPAISLARVQGAKTVAIITMTGLNELYVKSVYKGVIDGAEDNKLHVLADLTTVYAPNTTSFVDTLKIALEQLKLVKPDLVISVIVDCSAIVQAMKESNYTAGAILLAGCLSDNRFASNPGESGKYVYGPVQWDRRLNSRIFREDGASTLHFFPSTAEKASPQVFYESFYQRFNYTPSYFAAAQFACGLAVQGAAEFSNSLNTEYMRTAINTISEVTFYGQLQFNTFGQIVETGMGATVQVNKDGQQVIVLPVASAAAEFLYPMPTFAERKEVVSWYGTSAEQGIVAVAGFGILICVVLTVLFVAWRKRPQIIASSLLFVELIIAGAILIYASLFFWTLETTTVMCNLRYWFSGVGFVLMLSALLTKTWRVWRIFRDHSLKLIKLTNSYLLRILAVALAIEIVILIVWSAAFTPHVHTIVVDEHRPCLNYRTCVGSQTLPFAVASIVYHASLIIGGVLLGFLSRTIRSEYNESKFILIAMYNLTFSGLILLVLYAIQVSDRYVDFLIRSIAILWGVTATLCILFIPKIYFVVTGSNDPTRRKQHFTNAVPPMNSTNLPDSQAEVEEQLDTLARVEQRLRERLTELKVTNRRSQGKNQASKNQSSNTAGTSSGNSQK